MMIIVGVLPVVVRLQMYIMPCIGSTLKRNFPIWGKKWFICIKMRPKFDSLEKLVKLFQNMKQFCNIKYNYLFFTVQVYGLHN